MGIMITYHGYNNGYNNPMYVMHTETWVCIIHGKMWYLVCVCHEIKSLKIAAPQDGRPL